MTSGRCSGCGLRGSARAIRLHIPNCLEYQELYRTDPDRCLAPEAELTRFKQVEDTAEARALLRDARLRTRFAEMERLADRQANRWRKPKDILDD